mgnify:CR=1 FL=1
MGKSTDGLFPVSEGLQGESLNGLSLISIERLIARSHD